MTDVDLDEIHDPRPPTISDNCVGCSIHMKVYHRSWEFMSSRHGKVVCAPICADCMIGRPPREEKIVRVITERQDRLRRGGLQLLG